MPASKNGKSGYYTETMAPMPRAKRPASASPSMKIAAGAKAVAKKATSKSNGTYKTTMAGPAAPYKETMAMPAKAKKK